MNQIQDRLTQIDGLADQLRALRESAGMPGKDFAAALGWHASKVSRLENGKQKPSRDDLVAWARACQAGEAAERRLTELLDELTAAHRAWRKRASAGHAAVQSGYNELVARCTTVRDFTMSFVTGLLQTPAYAMTVLAEMKQLHNLATDNVEEAVRVRLIRQQYLYDNSKRFEFLLAEPVLRWGIGTPEMMRAQLDRLHVAANLPNVRLGILPEGRPSGIALAVTPQNSFCLYDDIAIVETFTAETVCREEESASYARIMDLLWKQAAVGPEALRLITNAMAIHQ